MAEPTADDRPLASVPGYACQVFPADAIIVTSGANLGDEVGDADVVCPGDVYQLDPEAAPLRLTIAPAAGDLGTAGRVQVVAPGSEVGQPGDRVELCARLMLMEGAGDSVELLILRHRDAGGAGGVYALPLSPMAPKTDYTLIRVAADPGAVRLADLVCISFGRGTMIALADGHQVPIETLHPGDRVLTRDHGPQPVRWIGRATLRAVGSFAPVVITAGTLSNSGDLIVGQHHRMFLYQRNRTRLVRTAELLVQAKHLVDDEHVFLREGGFVDYFSLIFDRHEIVYAEGIPAESLMVNDATLSHLPEDLAAEVKARFPGLSQHQHFGTEAGRLALDEIGAAALFRASRAG